MKKIILILILIISPNCSEKKTYSVTGTLIEINNGTNEFIIHHDEIPGFMMAMTMPFVLQDSTDIHNFYAGDSVHFKLIIEKKQSEASNFQLKGKGTMPNYTDYGDNEYTAFKIGEIFDEIVENLTLQAQEEELKNLN